jgi:hypothetical protein
MHVGLNRISLLIVGVTALMCSRTLLRCLADPEGPNLLVVTIGALIIAGSGLVMYRLVRSFIPLMSVHSQLLSVGCVIMLEIGVSAVLYRFL